VHVTHTAIYVPMKLVFKMLQNLPKTGGFSNDLAVLKVNYRTNWSYAHRCTVTSAIQSLHRLIYSGFKMFQNLPKTEGFSNELAI